MTQPHQFDLVAAPPASTPLSATLDETISALATFDVERLEALETQVSVLTTEYLTRELAEGREAMPELLRKHTLLGEMLNATAANLRVVAAVIEAKQAATRGMNLDRSNLASWPR